MKNDKNKTKAEARAHLAAVPEPLPPELGVTEAEIMAADRLLSSVAEEANREVDYEAMLRGIKAEAMKQGLAAELNKKAKASKAEKRSRLRRIAASAASIAAAFVLGMGVLSVIRAVDKAPASNSGDADTHQAFVSEAPTAAPQSGDVKSGDSIPDETQVPVYRTNQPISTPEASAPTENTYQSPEITPMPSEFAFRGGMRGYTYIKGFDTPETSMELVPPALPDFMEVEPAEEGLGFNAWGKDEYGSPCRIVCDLVEASEYDLSEGAAIYTLHDDGRVGYVWRINEKYMMHVDFEGFSYEDAELMLLSYSLPELAAEYRY